MNSSPPSRSLYLWAISATHPRLLLTRRCNSCLLLCDWPPSTLVINATFSHSVHEVLEDHPVIWPYHNLHTHFFFFLSYITPSADRTFWPLQDSPSAPCTLEVGVVFQEHQRWLVSPTNRESLMTTELLPVWLRCCWDSKGSYLCHHNSFQSVQRDIWALKSCWIVSLYDSTRL